MWTRSGSPLNNGNASSSFVSQAKLEELLAILSGSRAVLILTHDNPDPDALSAASCLKYIVAKRLGLRTRIGYGGIIGRAENRAMLRLLKIHTTKVSESAIRRYKSIILVDTQPMTGNNSLPTDVQATGVIDHHPQRKTTRAPFLDIRPDYGASASALTEYLFASGLDVPSNLATALFYGIASETQDLGREVSEADRKAYLALAPRTNWRVLSKIRRPALEKIHFAYISRAVANALTYKHSIATSLGRVDYADIVAEVAEMLLSLRRISWALCTGRYKDTILISLRTSRAKGRAGTVARRIVGPGNTAGGHDMIAGGQVDCAGKSETERDTMERKLIETFFRRMGKHETGELTRLVPPGETAYEETKKAAPAASDNTTKGEEVRQ
jgi:nanoRNase/pAp phosphatase (c-di-AMP/oligoRNAs hydrolase)